MQRDEAWGKLEAFAREELGKPLFGKLRLELSTRLEEDLGLTGVDAVEFIDHWVERFGITAKEFPYARYFGPEGLDVIGAIASIFSKRSRQPLVPITLGMLAEAMVAGHWDTEEIEAKAGANRSH
ncbi:DUF1493 family protein [Trinickia fusca]|uniref:DUF1493 family protein n=1 Tax=Trinickia fusca TaxID=2419777 RepID=A0A494XB19_9BURK|nr:DUF1493 family protein [Trinickia fusca]RKP45289.1 DUF1493 family protein [Trinickia fusca]